MTLSWTPSSSSESSFVEVHGYDLEGYFVPASQDNCARAPAVTSPLRSLSPLSPSNRANDTRSQSGFSYVEVEPEPNSAGVESMSSSPNSVRTPDDDIVLDPAPFGSMIGSVAPDASQAAFAPRNDQLSPLAFDNLSNESGVVQSQYHQQDVSSSPSDIGANVWPTDQFQTLPVNQQHYMSPELYGYGNMFPNLQVIPYPPHGPWTAEGPRYPLQSLPSELLFPPESPMRMMASNWSGAANTQMSVSPTSPDSSQETIASFQFASAAQPFQDPTLFTTSSNNNLAFGDLAGQFPSELGQAVMYTESQDTTSPTWQKTEPPSPGGSDSSKDVVMQSSEISSATLSPNLSRLSPESVESLVEAEQSPIKPDPPLSAGSTLDFTKPVSPQNYPLRTKPASVTKPSQRVSAHRPGGRQLGSKLDQSVALNANQMRKETACWHCVFQRDKCTPGDVCQRCIKRAQRSSIDRGIGCSRIKLVDSTGIFIPLLMASLHSEFHLKQFCDSNIKQWLDDELQLKLCCGDDLPLLTVGVYEFQPKNGELLRQMQYTPDSITGQMKGHEKTSPPLGITFAARNGLKKYEKYIDQIVEDPDHLDTFAKRCFEDDGNYFLSKLFRLMFSYRPKFEDEAKLVQEVYRLIVVTYIMTHTLTIPDDIRDQVLEPMQSFRTGIYSTDCSPRMTNKQLKFFFAQLHTMIMERALNKLQQIFKSSKGSDKWACAFIALAGIAMAEEEVQLTAHLTMDSKVQMKQAKSNTKAQQEANAACREIDSRFMFISNLFKLKYTHRALNPLRDSEDFWRPKFRDPGAVHFVRQLRNLMNEISEFLETRRDIEIAMENGHQYAGRLVARFLLSFYLPTAPTAPSILHVNHASNPIPQFSPRLAGAAC